MYRIEIAPRAMRQLRKLPHGVRADLIASIESLSENPRSHGTTKLKGRADQYRRRVGDYRIIFRIQDRELVVLILAAGDRKDIYG